MYLIGEALEGEGVELAHIDLLIGDKNGPVGIAFANAASQLSPGHTPLLAVIRPNLLTKPATLIIPKVTLRHEKQINAMFGTVQSAVAKAVADSLEEGVFAEKNVEELVLLVSAYLHPDAEDQNRIYRYNYGATKLAIRRAIDGFPDEKTVLYEKDRAAHAVMGFKVQRLWDPPYLQVALDLVEMRSVERVLNEVPRNDHVIIEAGTPLIKQFGLAVISQMRKIRPDAFIIADLKTLDTGHLEARMAANASADAVVVSGLAPVATLVKAILEAKKTGIYSIIDMLNVSDPAAVIKALAKENAVPDIVEMHRAIDAEGTEYNWGDIPAIRKAAGKKILVATAGGIRLDKVALARGSGADIVVVGRAITASKNIKNAAESFLSALESEEIDQFRIMTDF
jgi:bifunctional enzyme Fae/Hps